jgi:hypothetical protein
MAAGRLRDDVQAGRLGGPQLDPGRPIAIICAAGVRAGTATSLLRRHGAEHVLHIVDGGVPRCGSLGHELKRAPLDRVTSRLWPRAR